MFFLGQDIYSQGQRITVHEVRDGGDADPTLGGGRIRLVDLEITSSVSGSLDLTSQVIIRDVSQFDGTGARGWWHSDGATQATLGITLPISLAGGKTWRGLVPIRTPAGTPRMLYIYRTAQDAVLTDMATDGQLVVELAPDPFCASNIARVPMPAAPGGGDGDMINGTPILVPPGTNPIVAFALSKTSWPYVWGGESDAEGGYDCSGLMYAAYGSVGISLPRTAQAMWQSSTIHRITIAELKPGDLIFFHTDGSRPNDPPTHVGMYIGDVNGNGTPDLVQALSPQWGIRVDDNWITKSWLVSPWPDGTPRLWGAGYFDNPYRTN